jgi:hypothetical protein
MKKTFGWMALMVFTAAMVVPAVGCNSFGHRDARGFYVRDLGRIRR